MPLKIATALRKDRATSCEMQHRHFAFVASVIANFSAGENAPYAARTFAEACARTNKRFDRSRFMRACGLPASL